MRIRSRQEIAVKGIITFGAPASGGFAGVLPAGETLLVDQEPPAQATGAWLVPERYEHFESIYVPERDRKDPAYSDYALSISFDEVARHFDVLEERGPIQPPQTTTGSSAPSRV